MIEIFKLGGVEVRFGSNSKIKNANYLGVHTDMIYAMVKQKQLPHLKVQNRILFTKESIDLWIQDQEYTNLHS